MNEPASLKVSNTITHILWDLDGTLTDPAVGITSAVQYSLKAMHKPVPSAASLYPFIGPPLKASYCDLLGFSEKEAVDAIGYYREYYAEKGLLENTVYPGISALLPALQHAGKTLIVATSKPTIFARRILDHFELSACFAHIVGSNLDGSQVEKSEVIQQALNVASIPPSQCLMVGDRRFDIKGAHQNHIGAVGVLYGYGSKEELQSCRPEYLVEDVPALSVLLL